MKKKKMTWLLMGLICLVSMIGCQPTGDKLESIDPSLYNYPPLSEAMPEVDDHSELEFFSFDSEALLTQLTYRDVAGKAEIVYEKGENGGEERRFSRFTIYGKPSYTSGIWPAISVEGFSDSSYLAQRNDFSAYDGIEMDIRNLTDRQIEFFVLYQDIDYVRIPDVKFVLNANSGWTTIKVPMEIPEGNAFKKKEVGQIQMWVFNLKKGETPIKLDMDRMRFYKGA